MKLLACRYAKGLVDLRIEIVSATDAKLLGLTAAASVGGVAVVTRVRTARAEPVQGIRAGECQIIHISRADPRERRTCRPIHRPRCPHLPIRSNRIHRPDMPSRPTPRNTRRSRNPFPTVRAAIQLPPHRPIPNRPTHRSRLLPIIQPRRPLTRRRNSTPRSRSPRNLMAANPKFHFPRIQPVSRFASRPCCHQFPCRQRRRNLSPFPSVQRR